MQPEALGRLIVGAVCRATRTREWLVRGRIVSPRLTRVRAAAVRAMRVAGLSWQQAGDAINRTHSTAIYLNRQAGTSECTVAATALEEINR